MANKKSNNENELVPEDQSRDDEIAVIKKKMKLWEQELEESKRKEKINKLKWFGVGTVTGAGLLYIAANLFGDYECEDEEDLYVYEVDTDD